MGAVRGLSLVIPAYNEADVIARAVREADRALAKLFPRFEILVVDDGSSDGTATIVRELVADRPGVRLLVHQTNRGYGAALRTGFAAATHDLVAFTDADCQFDLSDLGPLSRLAETAPIAVGFRANRQDPWRRKFLSRGYNCLARTLLGTGVRDVDCALKVFRREILVQILPESRGFFVNTEMLTRARQLGLSVVEQAVTHRPRAAGDSKVSLREVPKTLRILLSFWWSSVARPWLRSRLARVTAPPVVMATRTTVPVPTLPRLPSTAPSRRAARPESLRGSA